MPKSPEAASAGPTEASAAPRRRQARGERRVAQLLEAAAGVFCRNGYAAASTNAIAREAGVSPGTLYQFFPNKEAIAVQLGDTLLHKAYETHGQAFQPENLQLPLPRMLDAVIDPVIAFQCENPALWALMHGSGIPGHIDAEHKAFHETLQLRVEGALSTFAPDLTPAERARTANMVLSIFKSALDLILTTEGDERAAYIAELKTVLLRYLEPLVTVHPATS
ncbi:TetR/AcrR family transcriptional regulator [Streptomyces sp. NRRL S-87]|uniref:TetR/AcrR family transcriptional regulator n=1 Tax=Streptomyces sp. NRRL S-87 TaxID=1463920 RepID=UPI000B187346|nr:TetR/AcrR family transcriptional regulator [Streptomyces sp. NRRL S-87]